MTIERKEKLIDAYVEGAIEIDSEIITRTLKEILFLQPDKFEQYVKDFMEYVEELELIEPEQD
mgnify:CR=1 FL=1|jgi:hypothetical protein